MVVSVSMWPFVVSVGSLVVVMGVISVGSWGLISGLMLVSVGLWMWAGEDQLKWVGVVGEVGNSSGKMGVLIFIFSEFVFFFSLVVSGTYLVEEWDMGEVVDMEGAPLLISLVLLSSGVSVTVAHQFLHSGRMLEAGLWEGVTVFLGLLFLGVQYEEWISNWFEFGDGVGGSLFYFVTGFHGLHVLLGVSLNAMMVIMLVGGGCNEVGEWKAEGVVWYWHFVDVVWLFVYLVVYWYCM
uniref:Cytochrome c oxidase subunit 3 n=1 Tax=Sphaerirostris lanceoides TaxID=2169581 RepID=A0A6M8YKY1_9BILA|nr:cytochrome c oxidase subunit 3 [Sphaerirostris lanceoides]